MRSLIFQPIHAVFWSVMKIMFNKMDNCTVETLTPAKSISEREQELALENVKLKRLLAEKSEEVDILKKAAAYFARSLK